MVPQHKLFSFFGNAVYLLKVSLILRSSFLVVCCPIHICEAVFSFSKEE